MPQRRTLARTRLVSLLTVALLVSMLGATSAGAASVDTSFSCPGSIAAAGFTDITTHDVTTQRAIDCLAVHDITKGTSPTTFNPSGTVPRWQMALFLVRQAASHGMTVPAPVGQGFTDLGGLSSEARDAVNQLAQLGITLGTSETTFSPDDDVTRWQMALFITRLLAGSGVALPAATDQGFQDLDGLSVSAQNAIDQLAVLGIGQGTSDTTFSPYAETLRWHMALFLTRALAVGGILPPGVKALVVSPGTSTYLDFQGTTVSRQYTVGVSTDGPFTIELWPASLIRANGTFEASSPGSIANCDLTLVDGVAASADKVTGIEPTGSTLTFTVGCVGTGDEVVPVVYTGTSLTGLTGATAVDAKAPTNDAVGIGGGVTVVVEAASGAFGPIAVDGVDKVGSSFTSGGVTYFWDSNDTFMIGGVAVTMAEWVAALTTGDDLLSGSSYDPGGTSVFDLHDGAPVAPGLSLVGVTSTTATLTYTAAPGSDQIEIYACEGTGCETTLVRSVVAGTDEDGNTAGTQLVITGLTPATDYDFQAVQIEGTSKSDKSAAVDVDTPVALSIVSVAVTEPNDGANYWSGIRVDFDDVVEYDSSLVLANFQVHTTDSPETKISASTLVDGDNDSQILLVFPSQADTDPDTDWVLTIHAGALDVGAGGDPNGVLTAEFSH
jgi:hypothetical protein